MPTLVYEEPGHKLIHTLSRKNIIVEVGPNRFQISDDIFGSQTAISRPDESVLVRASSFYINPREPLTISLLDENGKGYTVARKD